MPAAAVIPAPIAYVKVVAVKKLVVGSRCRAGGAPVVAIYCQFPGEKRPAVFPLVLLTECLGWPERLL